MSVDTSTEKPNNQKSNSKSSTGVLLRAQFNEMLLLNFEIDPEIIKPHLPPGLSLAYFNETAFISLIAKKVRRLNYGGFVLPMLPYATVGLRVYVQRKVGSETRRGIYYLKEFVQRKSVASVINWFFQSPPKVLKIKSESSGFNESDSAIMPSATYRWMVNEQWNRVRVTGHSLLRIGERETKEKFILDCKNLYYRRKNELCECYSEHPPWVTWGAASGSFDCDTEALFRREFVKPLKRRAASVFLARGSEVSIHRPTVIGK